MAKSLSGAAGPLDDLATRALRGVATRDMALDPPACLACATCAPGCAEAAAAPELTRAAMAEARQNLLGLPPVPAPRQCWHCAHAPCVEVCPAGAMRREAESGLVWVDRPRCAGCWMCVLACPFGAVLPSGDGRCAVKCDGCRGCGVPACAGVCRARDALFAPVLLGEASRARRAGYAIAGWGGPPTASYPPPRANSASVAAPPAPAERPHRYLIVGGGIAAVQAVEAIRRSGGRGPITLVSDEAHPPYSRVLLSHFLAGLRDGLSLALRPANWSAEMGVALVAGDGACGVDVARRRVLLRSGRVLSYDRLLIATGASPVRPPIPGANLEGVHGLRTLADAEAIRARAPATVVVVGGGFIGIKVAEALTQRAVRVAVVEKMEHLLPQMLDAHAAQLVRARLEAHGIRVVVGDGVREIEGRDRARRVVLESGERLGSDMVVVGTGVAPNVRWLCGTPLATDRGVTVDVQMRTNAPGVWAAGDVAVTRDLLSGERVVSAIWPAAAAQGRVAGTNMAGGHAVYEASLAMNTLNVLGLALASFGQVRGGRVEVSTEPPARYLKKVYRDGALVGAVLVGDLREAGRLLAELRRSTATSSLNTPDQEEEGRHAC